jgi:steroid 5-alpha reductase family enzyme
MLAVGTFLFSRITSEDGRDSRFDEIRKSPPKFLGAFFAQATWVSLCLLPVLAVNSIPATTLSALPFLTLTDVIGVALFIGGLSFEATADKQKSQWMEEKKNKKHNEDFLTRGLWSKSRHPNYFGESTLWTGIATVAGMGFSGSIGARLGALAMAGVSPAFVTFLLLKVSSQNVLTCRFECSQLDTGFGCSSQRDQVRQALRGPQGLPAVEEGMRYVS